MRFLYPLIVLCFCSCSAGWHLKTAIRKGAIVSVDTVYQEVSVMVPEVRIDTVMQVVNFSDTIVVVKDSVVTKVKINTVEKTAYISTKCPERIRIVRVPYQVKTEIKAPPPRFKWWHVAIASVIGVISGIIIHWLGVILLLRN